LQLLILSKPICFHINFNYFPIQDRLSVKRSEFLFDHWFLIHTHHRFTSDFPHSEA